MKKILLLAIFVTILSSLLVNQTFAHEINVFAPWSYAGVLPSNPSPFVGVGAGAWPPPFSSAFIDPNTGNTILNAFPTTISSAYAYSYFTTGWWQFNPSLPTQNGSVTADTWLYYNISGLAGIRAYLQVFENTVPSFTGYKNLWIETVSDGLPGVRENSFDLNVNIYDRSVQGNYFRWTSGHWYWARVLLWAYASSPYPPNFFLTYDGKFDDILFITYTSSTGQDFLPPPLSPTVSLSPPVGPVGTNVAVSGQDFAPNELVTVYWDSLPMNQTQTNAAGSFFNATISVPSGSTLGAHVISAIGAQNDSADSFFDVFAPAPPLVSDINGDGKVNLLDLVLLAKNYGRTDPNSGVAMGPGIAGPATVLVNGSVLALIAAVPVNLFRRRQKEQRKPKPETQRQ